MQGDLVERLRELPTRIIRDAALDYDSDRRDILAIINEVAGILDMLKRAARLASECDVDVSLRELDGRAVLMIDSSDLWGYSDAEEVTPALLDAWETAVVDVKAVLNDAADWPRCSVQLALARIAKTRPQGAYYKYFPKKTWALFNACGPHRPSELGNPEATPEAE